jgi:gamma-glutamyltranspeptidase / glutathione hydrolase
MDLSWEQPYPSGRSPVFASNLVASSQPLAVQAGLEMLRIGGNAVDAALATAIALTVVEPTSNGIGGDAFAIVWDGTAVHGLNSSGASPAYWTRAGHFSRYHEMPRHGWDSVTVPGAVAAWVALSDRFGALPFERLFQSAIRYAKEGFVVSPIVARSWGNAQHTFKDYPDFVEAFLPGGMAPKVGERFALPDQADSLQRIAETKGQSFYRGELAGQICDAARAAGAAWSEEDLANHRAQWVEPMSVDYQGYQVHEIPPNGQGLTALIALGLLNHCPAFLDSRFESEQSVHIQIEACKRALELAQRHIADPGFMKMDPQALLNREFLAREASKLNLEKAQVRNLIPHKEAGTVYLSAADSRGMMVSFIQSNYCGFGSGIVIPGTGISMQNRGFGFNLIPGHPNEVGPQKKPFHTIIPGFVSRGNQAVMSFGVMGGPMQAQGHLQMILRVLTGKQNPQAASDAPRWYIHEDGVLGLEKLMDSRLVEALRGRGHHVFQGWSSSRYGGAQLILRHGDGYCGASDHRKDGQVSGF